MYIFLDYEPTKDKGIIKSEFLKNIREHFSIEDDKANLKKHIFKYKPRFIPSRIYAITEAGRFELGLLVEILKYLKSLNTPFKIVFSEEFKKRYHCNYEFANEPLAELTLPYRDYQIDGIKKGLANGNGIILVQTGGGKTLMMGGLIASVQKNQPNTKTLIITPTHLVNQTYNEFLSYGFNPVQLSKWSGDNELDQTTSIIIAGSNIVTSKIDNTALDVKKAKVVHLTLKKKLDTDLNLPVAKREEIKVQIEKVEKDLARLIKKDDVNKKIHNFLETIGLLIIDEIHTLKKDNEITNITKYVSSRNRFGFTGTLPESLIDQWTIIGKIGPVVYETPREMLVDRKFITDVEVQILKLHYNDEPDYLDMDMKTDDEDEGSDESPTSRYEAELEFLQTNSFRNGIIKKITEKLNNNILIVLDRLPHGEYLLKYLTTVLPNKKVYFIKGEVETEDREKIQKLMETENNIICIAISKIFSTGINIKNLHYIIFANAGKAKVKTIQTIGRGVRMIAGKEKVVIFDLADVLHYGRKHLQKRIQLYENEELKYKTIDIQEPD